MILTFFAVELERKNLQEIELALLLSLKNSRGLVVTRMLLHPKFRFASRSDLFLKSMKMSADFCRLNFQNMDFLFKQFFL